MAFGLPARDEPNWDTKLDASINAVKATADEAAAEIAGRLSESSLTASYALKVAPDIVGSSTQRARFNQVQGSGNKGGFTSYIVDGSGKPVAGGLVVRENGDTSEGTINWSHNGDSGYLIHLTAATGMTSTAGLLGVGISASLTTAVTGIVTSQKGLGIGLGPNNTETAKWTGNGDASTGYAIKGGNLGGVWLRADMGNSGYASGHLIELHGWTGVTNGARMITLRDQTDKEYWYVDPATKQMWLLQGGATPANDHRTTWEHGNGAIQKMYVYTGSGSNFFGSQIRAQSNLLKLDVAQSAAIGSHSYQTAFVAQATGSGAAVALYGGSPVVQPIRVGQLTDNTTGSVTTSIGDSGAAYNQATLNSIHASLIAKINSIEAKLSAAGGGIGVTA